MPRKTLILIVLSAFILTVMIGSVLAEVNSAKQADKLMTGAEKSDVDGQFVYNAHYAPSASPGITMGTTWYDYQHNGTSGRQVSYWPGSTNLHFVWMKGRNRFYVLCSIWPVIRPE